MAPLCALIFALCLPLAPNDLWYHVRAGEFIARGGIPNQNLMSSAVPLETPYYYQSWLAELALYKVLDWNGLSGLMLLRGFCLSGTVLLVVAATFRRLLRLENAPSRLHAARITALGAILGFAIASNNVDLRPQSFSVFFFGLWIFAILEFRATEGRKQFGWGAFLVGLTAVWANTHGAFVVSVLGLAALGVGDLVARHGRTRASLVVAAASLLVVGLNPRGFGLLIYVAQLSNNEIGQRFIQEWKSPGFDEWHSILFWLSAGGLWLWILLSLSIAKSKTENLGELLVFALFFVMGARDQRAMIWFALWMIPIFGVLAAGGWKEKETPIVDVPRAAQLINAVLLIFLLMGPVALLPGVKAGLPWPEEFRRRFAPTPSVVFPGDPPLLLENTTAVVPAGYLRKNPPRGLLFTDMVCGSYLTWALHPQVKPLCDPRIELFPVSFWEDYVRLSNGPLDAAQELARRGFSDALLDRDSQPGLVKRLKESPEWKNVAQNGSTILFRRREGNTGNRHEKSTVQKRIKSEKVWVAISLLHLTVTRLKRKPSKTCLCKRSLEAAVARSS